MNSHDAPHRSRMSASSFIFYPQPHRLRTVEHSTWPFSTRSLSRAPSLYSPHPTINGDIDSAMRSFINLVRAKELVVLDLFQPVSQPPSKANAIGRFDCCAEISPIPLALSVKITSHDLRLAEGRSRRRQQAEPNCPESLQTPCHCLRRSQNLPAGPLTPVSPPLARAETTEEWELCGIQSALIKDP